MAKKNKLPPPSSPAAASNKRRRIAAPPPVASTSADKPTTTSSHNDNNNAVDKSVRSNTSTNKPSSDAIIHFAPGSKIQQKVRSVLAALNTSAVKTPSPSSSPGVAHLEARAPAANKLITVLEIAKRQLEAEGRAWWSYAGVRGELTEMEREPKAKTKAKVTSAEGGKDEVGDKSKEEGEAKVVVVEEEEEEEEEAFEPLGKTGMMPGKKVRNVPILVAYLATQPVPALKALYGEQHGVS